MRIKRGYLVLIILALAVLGTWAAQRIFNPFGLEGIEHICLDRLLSSPSMAGITDFKISKHYNWWEKTYSESGFIGGALYEPYQDPKAEMFVAFLREDGRQHHAWVTCLYTIVPDSGDPPHVAFDRVDLFSESVFDSQTRTWTPWHAQ